jgi:hypothetical protein
MFGRLLCLALVVIVLGAYLPYCSSLTDSSDAINVQPASAASSYSPQNRTSTYTPQTSTLPSYSNVTMTSQRDIASNTSLVEKTLEFNLSTVTIQTTFNLASNEPFIAIDGCSQSTAYKVNFTINFPNGSRAIAPYTTLEATSMQMHYFTVNPPAGTWTIIATAVDPALNTAWLQVTSYNNGTKLCDSLEKIQVNLVPGQTLYCKIPLTPSDWFYLYADHISGPYATINLRKNGTYGTLYKDYSVYSAASELFSSKVNPNGTYLLQIYSQGSGNTAVFVEIIKASGVTLQFNPDQGKMAIPYFGTDLEFFKVSITQNYDWISFDGGLSDASSGKTARFLIIDPNLNIIFDGTANYLYDFQEKMVANNPIGTFYIGIFVTAYANANFKVTTSTAVQTIPMASLDQNVTFTQSGQPYFMKIPQSQIYFLFAGYTFGPAQAVKYSIFFPNTTTVWYQQIYAPNTLFPPTIPTVPFFILKLQGEKDSSSLFHVRFQGFEDYTVQTPDCGNYNSRFTGDLILSTIIIRNSDYVFQHSGVMTGSSNIVLFDSKYVQKSTVDFTSTQQTNFAAWRKGYENPPSGNWLQVFIDTGTSTPARVETSTLQKGDEIQTIKTPNQFNQTIAWNDWWKVDIIDITVNSPNWFGIITKLFSVNSSYSYHPSLTGYVYDSSLANLQSRQIVSYSSTIDDTIWQNPKQGHWIFVLIGFQHSLKNDPLSALVSFVGDADFHQDWPTNLNGNTYATTSVINNVAQTITVLSNSTISNFALNPQNEQISLTTSGTAGNNIFCVVTIPKTLSIRPFTTLIDGNNVNDILSQENDTHTSIYFAYPQVNHQITIASTTSLDHFIFNSIPSQIAGSPFVVTVTAVDSLGNTFSGYTGTPTLTYSGGTITPASATGGFSNGVWAGLVTVTTAGSNKAIGINDGSGHVGTSNSFTVAHATSISTILITPASSSVTAGGSKTFSALASDLYGNTWDVTSSTIWSITSGTGGSWSGNVYTSKTAGLWTITATYSSTPYTTSLTVNPSALDHFIIATIGAQTANSSFSLTITAKDAYGNTVTSYSGAPTLTVSAGSITPTTMSAFVSGVGSTSVIIRSSASSTTSITITTTDGGQTGTSNTFTLNPANSDSNNSGDNDTVTVNPVITATAGIGGSISPSGAITVNAGSSKTFNITPNTGYYIVDVKVNGHSVGAVSSYTLKNIQSDSTISATFARKVTPSPVVPEFAPSSSLILLAATMFAITFIVYKKKK